jgi:hypothetical protein
MSKAVKGSTFFPQCRVMESGWPVQKHNC